MCKNLNRVLLKKIGFAIKIKVLIKTIVSKLNQKLIKSCVELSKHMQNKKYTRRTHIIYKNIFLIKGKKTCQIHKKVFIFVCKK